MRPPGPVPVTSDGLSLASASTRAAAGEGMPPRLGAPLLVWLSRFGFLSAGTDGASTINGGSGSLLFPVSCLLSPVSGSVACLATLVSIFATTAPTATVSPSFDEDLQHTRDRGRDLLRRLVGAEFVERLIDLDVRAVGLEPAVERALADRLAGLRNLDLFDRHAVPSVRVNELFPAILAL